MTNIQSNSNSKNPKQNFDLEERTIKFSENLIDFLKTLEQSAISKPLINQTLRSGTSIGANYSEANECNSKKDFINKIAIAKKESKETKYWLRIIAHTFPEIKPKIRTLWQEAQELKDKDLPAQLA